MKPLAPEHLRRLKPYDPGKPIAEVRRELGIPAELEIIKLASNENAHGPSPKAVQAAARELAEAHRYPDGGGFYLRRALGERLGVDPRRVVLGNGSNELLELLIRAFVGPGETAVVSASSFVVYKLVLMGLGRELHEVPLRGDLAFDLRAMAAAVNGDPRVKMVFLASPNNPTGSYIGAEALAQFLGSIPEDVVVIMDEAYREYVTAADYPDSLAIQADRPRTLTLRTFSKAYGLAGMRIGYGIVSEEVADVVHRLRQPFNCNAIAQAAALAALDDDEHLQTTRRLNGLGIRQLEEGLRALGLQPQPTQANFILVGMGVDAAGQPRTGKPIFDAMLREGVILRVMDGYGLPGHLRITVGAEAENDRCLQALADVLGRG